MTTAIDRLSNPNVPTPGHIGQATAIEQSRAVAEVQAAVVVAQQCPRDLQVAVRQMKESCAQTGLAERAFFRFPRAGSTVSGPSVHLARELARCWGNIQYGVAELRRNDAAGYSEMQAFAWDVQTNTRSAQIFVVPHKRDTKKGQTELVDLRDIYENNANNGARRVRECIFSILPPWFVDDAKDLCMNTLKGGGGVPLPQRIAKAVEAFGTHGVTVDQLENKLGRKSASWTEHDVAQLQVTFKSLQRGEITRDEEFPTERVSAAELAAPAPAATVADPDVPETDWPAAATPGGQ